MSHSTTYLLSLISYRIVFITLLLAQVFFAQTARAVVCIYQFNDTNQCNNVPEGDGTIVDRCKTFCSGDSAATGCAVEDECPNVPQNVNKEKTTDLVNPLGGNAAEDASAKEKIGKNIDPATIIGDVIGKTLGVIGAITLAVFLYGGFRWLTSAGNEQRVDEGNKTMLYAVIGLFIIFASYAILQLIFTGLQGSQ